MSCRSILLSGSPCTNYVAPGHEYCRLHHRQIVKTHKSYKKHERTAADQPPTIEGYFSKYARTERALALRKKQELLINKPDEGHRAYEEKLRLDLMTYEEKLKILFDIVPTHVSISSSSSNEESAEEVVSVAPSHAPTEVPLHDNTEAYLDTVVAANKRRISQSMATFQPFFLKIHRLFGTPEPYKKWIKTQDSYLQLCLVRIACCIVGDTIIITRLTKIPSGMCVGVIDILQYCVGDNTLLDIFASNKIPNLELTTLVYEKFNEFVTTLVRLYLEADCPICGVYYDDVNFFTVKPCS